MSDSSSPDPSAPKNSAQPRESGGEPAQPVVPSASAPAVSASGPASVPTSVPTSGPTSGPVPATGSTSAATTQFWLRRGDQVFLAAALGTVLCLLGAHWLRLSDWGRSTIEIDRLPESWYEYKIDLNRAGWVEWAQFEGIGETLARRIVADREQNGPFRNVDDLLRVKGIGPKKLEEIRAHVMYTPYDQADNEAFLE
jgi:competence protein ComEA